MASNPFAAELSRRQATAPAGGNPFAAELQARKGASAAQATSPTTSANMPPPEGDRYVDESGNVLYDSVRDAVPPVDLRDVTRIPGNIGEMIYQTGKSAAYLGAGLPAMLADPQGYQQSVDTAASMVTAPVGAAVDLMDRQMRGIETLGGQPGADTALAAGALVKGFPGRRPAMPINSGVVKGNNLGFHTRAQRNAAPTAAAASERLTAAEAMRNVGIDPFGPAIANREPSAFVKQLSEVPILGKPLADRMRSAVSQARDAAGRIAGKYGAMTTAEEGGNVVRAGAERFKDARPQEVVEGLTGKMTPEQISEIVRQPARETSLKTKQAALYDRAWNMIPEEMRQGRTVKDDPRVLGGMANAQAQIIDIVNRNLGMMNKAALDRKGGGRFSVVASGDPTVQLPELRTKGSTIPREALPVQGGMLGNIVKDIAEGKWRGPLQDMRNIRSELRRLHSGMSDTERNTLRLSDIEGLQSAITRDMIYLLERNAKEYAAAGNHDVAANFRRSVHAFRQADKFTRLSMQRLDEVERLFNAPSAESLSRSILQASLNKGRGNLGMLRSARRILRDADISDLASSVIHEMGQPVGSARGLSKEQGFSVASFTTRWENMAPEARDLLFNSRSVPGLRTELNNLVKAVGRLAEYEALTNSSRTATNAIAMGSMVGGVAYAMSGPEQLMHALTVAGGTYAAARFMASPSYVRWLTRATKIQAMPPARKAALWTRHIDKLRQMAGADPVLGQTILAALGAQPAGERSATPEMRP